MKILEWHAKDLSGTAKFTLNRVVSSFAFCFREFSPAARPKRYWRSATQRKQRKSRWRIVPVVQARNEGLHQF